MKNEPGDFVVHRWPDGVDRLGRVLRASRESVTVRFRDPPIDLTFEHPLPRARWSHRGGYKRWSR